jgi:beta-N-acetylhexosaminidase
MKPLILGISGLSLSHDERRLLASADPAGVILFARNIEDPVQVRALTDDLRRTLGRDDLAILVDQEGGRVARLGPPHWPALPAARVFGELYERAPLTGLEAARLNAAVTGAMLANAGITVACAPVIDVAADGADNIIGDRAFSSDPVHVASLGAATLRGLAEAGVVGIVKHMPGHGRAPVDSHTGLPVVEASRDALAADFHPFRQLAGAPMAMAAHVVYAAIDAGNAASVSPAVIGDVIRGDIGFAGLLVSDDIAMAALSGPLERRAAAVLAAGCDLALFCGGGLDDNARLCAAVGEITDDARRRLGAAMASVRRAETVLDSGGLLAARDALMAAA